jgi:hypothetical protein
VQQAVGIRLRRHHARSQREGGLDASSEQPPVDRLVARGEDAHGDRPAVRETAAQHALAVVEHRDHAAGLGLERLERFSVQPWMTRAHAALERLSQARLDVGAG